MNMNRRHFLRSCAMATVSIPCIGILAKQPSPPNLQSDHAHIVGEAVEILSLDEIKPYGIRCAVYCASCVDKNGRFFGDHGYDNDHSEPFIRRTFKLHSLPTVYDERKSFVMSVLDKMRSGNRFDGKEYSVEKVIDEIREKMEYVCLIWYCKVPCICGQRSCHSKYWIPAVGGLSKHRYNLYLDQMNQ